MSAGSVGWPGMGELRKEEISRKERIQKCRNHGRMAK
jgi:hypothetical protein